MTVLDDFVPFFDEFGNQIEALVERPAKAAQTPEQKQRRKPGETWKPVDLAVVLNAGYEPPKPSLGAVEDTDFGLFYEGRINAVFGDSGGGKSWLTMWLIKQAMEAGRDAALIDYEDHPAAAVARLEQLGCKRDAILKHLIYFNPSEQWNTFAERELGAAVADRDLAVAVLDSTGEGMALDGVNPNSDDEVARWFQGCAKFLSRAGAAVILVDHVVKAQQNGRNTDFASGSQRKRAAINGAAYFLDVIEAPSRDTDGKFKLVTRKDRFGWRKHGTVACEVEMENTDTGGVLMKVKQPEKKAAPEQFRYTWYMQRVSEFMEENGMRVSLRDLRSAPIGPKGRTAAKDTIDKAVESLRAEGFITSDKGVTPIVLGKPYREAEDPRSDKYEPI